MRLFVSNKKIQFLTKIIESQQQIFDQVFDCDFQSFEIKKAKGRILIRSFTEAQIIKVLLDVDKISLPDLVSISFLVKENHDLKNEVKAEFRIIHAAGGMVFKEEKVLLIHRLGCWDLPKGKKEKFESSEQCSIREIVEECGVIADIDFKICSTWHSYHSKGKNILKKTKWFAMTCNDDSDMSPQQAEGIDEVAWKTLKEAKVLLEKSSYESIKEVLIAYEEKHKNKAIA